MIGDVILISFKFENVVHSITTEQEVAQIHLLQISSLFEFLFYSLLHIHTFCIIFFRNHIRQRKQCDRKDINCQTAAKTFFRDTPTK